MLEIDLGQLIQNLIAAGALAGLIWRLLVGLFERQKKLRAEEQEQQVEAVKVIVRAEIKPVTYEVAEVKKVVDAVVDGQQMASIRDDANAREQARLARRIETVSDRVSRLEAQRDIMEHGNGEGSGAE